MNYLAQHKMSLLYLVIGQIGWFACVLSAARGFPWAGVAVVLLFVIWHIAYARRSLQELKLVASVAVIGAIWESAVRSAGLMSYPQESASLHLAPLWIIALWGLFAAQLNVAYGWLKTRLAVAALLGAVAGPLSFRAGASLHAVRFEQGWRTAGALAVGWAFLLPMAILLSRRWDGVAAEPQPMLSGAAAMPRAGQ